MPGAHRLGQRQTVRSFFRRTCGPKSSRSRSSSRFPARLNAARQKRLPGLRQPAGRSLCRTHSCREAMGSLRTECSCRGPACMGQ
eukprot:3211846-Prymnesium_polylepis.1